MPLTHLRGVIQMLIKHLQLSLKGRYGFFNQAGFLMFKGIRVDGSLILIIWISLMGSFISYIRQFSEKLIFLPPDTHTDMSVSYLGVKNVSFSENFAYVRNEWSLFSHIKSHFCLHCLRNISLETSFLKFNYFPGIGFQETLTWGR